MTVLSEAMAIKRCQNCIASRVSLYKMRVGEIFSQLTRNQTSYLSGQVVILICLFINEKRKERLRRQNYTAAIKLGLRRHGHDRL